MDVENLENSRKGEWWGAVWTNFCPIAQCVFCFYGFGQNPWQNILKQEKIYEDSWFQSVSLSWWELYGRAYTMKPTSLYTMETRKQIKEIQEIATAKVVHKTNEVKRWKDKQEMIHIYMRIYAAIKRSEILMHVTMYMNFSCRGRKAKHERSNIIWLYFYIFLVLFLW